MATCPATIWPGPVNGVVCGTRRTKMYPLLVMYLTATLMAFVAVACSVLCLVWTIPSWRRRLAQSGVTSEVHEPKTGRLTGWPAKAGSSFISIGIAACAVVAWYGSYCMLAACWPN